MKKFKLILLSMCLLMGIVGCSNEINTTSEEKTEISLVTVEAVEPIVNKIVEVMEEKGYDVTVTLVDQYVPIMQSVEDESVDAGHGVQLKFLQSFNEENNGDLTMAKPYPFYSGIGLYSNKYDNPEDFEENAEIAIMNDPSNMDMCLRMLRDHGLIELDESFKGLYTTLEITENPKNISFIEADQTQTLRMIDELDGVCVWFEFVKNAGMDPKDYIARNLDGEEYPIAVVIRNEDKDSQWAKDIALACHDERVKDFVLTEFDGVYDYFNVNLED